MELLYVAIFCVVGIVLFFVVKQNKEKLMLDFIEKLRADLRSGIDKNTEQMRNSLHKNSESVQTRLDETLKLLNQQLHGVRKTVDTRMDQNTKSLNSRLDNAAAVINGVREEMGRMKEIGTQIKKLHEVLGGQKLRGNLGEEIMNDLIIQLIPPANYEFQYPIEHGNIVDAVIRTANGLIPIDSKFPLENYRKILLADDDKVQAEAQRAFVKNVKKHLTDIHKKYINPEKGTVDFAMMYVPADSVYFEIVVNNAELSDYARQKNIYIVSPSIFYAFLQVILMSYQSQEFEKNAKNVLLLIKGIKKESEKFGGDLQTLNKHLSNAKTKMDDVNRGYVRLDGKIGHASGESLESGKRESKSLTSATTDTSAPQHPPS